MQPYLKTTSTKEVLNKQPEDVAMQKQTEQAPSSALPAAGKAENTEQEEEMPAQAQGEQASLNMEMPPVTETEIDLLSSENAETDTDPALADEAADSDGNTNADTNDVAEKIIELIAEADDKYYPVCCYLKESEISVAKEQITIPVNSHFLYNQVEEVMSVIHKKLKEFYGIDFKIDIPIRQAQDAQVNIDWSNPDEVYRWMVQNNSKINDFKIALNLNIRY
ncbi:MAG: hypothetical protein J5701_00975 [Bacteroidales bacterium]|nr:hypothetical protein [Bacteroidales bacterium]